MITNVFVDPENIENERNPTKSVQKGSPGPENRNYISNRIMG